MLRLFNFPTPLALPFGFPNNQKKYWINIPILWRISKFGVFLKRRGILFTLSDKTDLSIKGDIYSKGSWGLNHI